jgi:hypothetical protein
MPRGRALFDKAHLHALLASGESHQFALGLGEQLAPTGDERALAAFAKGVEVLNRALAGDSGFDSRGLLELAIECFSVAVVLEPDMADGYLGLIACYQELGELGEPLEQALIALAYTAELLGATQVLTQLQLVEVCYRPFVACTRPITTPIDARLALVASALNRGNLPLADRWLPRRGFSARLPETRVLGGRLLLEKEGWLAKALQLFQVFDEHYRVDHHCDRLLGLAVVQTRLDLFEEADLTLQSAHAYADELALTDHAGASRVTSRALYLGGQLSEREQRHDLAVAEYRRIKRGAAEYEAAQQRLRELTENRLVPDETDRLFEQLIAPLEQEFALNAEIDERMLLFEDPVDEDDD